MAYINGKKIFQVVKTAKQHYKHSVKLQGVDGGYSFTIYADIIFTDAQNWQGSTWSNVIPWQDFPWEGIIVGKDTSNNLTFQYMEVFDPYQTCLYYDIEDKTSYYFIDIDNLVFITDTVTPILTNP